MRGFIIAVLLLALVASTVTLGADSIKQLIEEKARLTKSSVAGG